MVILLNGCINSGKTTIGKYIANSGLSIAHIEVDSLREFIRWMPLNESIEINLDNALCVAVNFHKRNIDSVMTYPLSDKSYHYVCDRLEKEGISYCAVTLFTELHDIKRNRGNRELNDWELNRIDELFDEGLARPTFGTIINNSKQSIEVTAKQVLELANLT